MNLYYSFYKGLPRRSKALLLPKLLSSQTNHHNDNDVIGRIAAFSSSSREEDQKKNYNRNYLDNWVGTISNKTGNSSVNSSTDNNNPTATVKTTQQSSFTQSQAQTLQITGSSYLLPTLRLPSNTTASSLSKNLSFFLLRDTSSHAMKSMLKPTNWKTKSLSSSSSWKVPIILDLAEYQHDGSPHYKPPPSNFLKSIVSVLDKEFGICVIGLTNVQQIPGEHVNEDMISLGLPVVLGRAGVGVNGSGSTRTNNNSNSVGIEELIQLVLKKNDEESVLANEKEKEEEMNENSKGNDIPENSSINSTSHNDIMNKMTFRELQTECKSLGLGAIGSTSVLQTRLLDYYEYNNDLEKDGQQGKEDKDKKEDSNDTVNKHSDITPTPPPTASNNLSIDTPSISSSVTLTSSTVDSSPSITSLPTDDAAAAAFVHAKIYHGSVRSGQQISTDEPNQSLIIMGNVNSGGEVMADGSIYIFGRLRGRALAGLKESPSSSSNFTNKEQQEKGENTNDSKIICTHFDAELICIGESFTTIDDSNMDSTIGVKQGSSVIITKDEKDGSLHFVGF